MIKVNVGMSRKVSKDYNSTGFSINLEGEVSLNLDDQQLVIEKIKELYDFAEESLSQQIERHNSDTAIASHDAEFPSEHASTKASHPFTPRQPAPTANGPSRNGMPVRSTNPANQTTAQPQSRFSNSNSAPEPNSSQDVAATNKQLQFMLTLAKRQGMNQAQLEDHAASLLGKRVGLYDLTKQEANQLITELNGAQSNARRS